MFHIAEQLAKAGLEPKLDKWDLVPGRRLWDQIDKHISDPSQSDAWIWFASQSSLGSEPCREEYAYALDRALKSRSDAFPVIALSQGPAAHDLLPAGIRTRLYVSLEQGDWVERIVAGVEGTAPGRARASVDPYELTVHDGKGAGCKFVVEVRPRAGTWGPAMMGIPAAEVERTRYMVPVCVSIAPKGTIPAAGMKDADVGPTEDGSFAVAWLRGESTPTKSLYGFFSELPSAVVFGQSGGPLYTVTLK